MDIKNQLKSSMVIALQGLTLYGLLGQLRTYDGPSQLELGLNLLNPWLTLLHYGASWNHWGGPYSIFWYWISYAITLGANLPYTPVLYAINLMIQFRLRHSILAIPFGACSLFGILSWPQNMIIMWLLFLGFYSKWGLLLAPVLKLPIGSFSPEVWNLVFNSHTALRDPGNWFSYLWLATLWVAGLVVLWERGRRGNLHAVHPAGESMLPETAREIREAIRLLYSPARTEPKNIQGREWEGIVRQDDDY